MYIRLGFMWFFLSALSMVVGCSSESKNGSGTSEGVKVPVSALQLKPSANCDELKTYLEESWTEQFTSARMYPLGGPSVLRLIPEDSSVTSPPSPDDVSQTNTQEPGVDEADLVKADYRGNLYAVNKDFFVIEKGFPPQELGELSRLSLNSWGQELYLNEDHQQVMILGRTPFAEFSTLPLQDLAPFLGSQLIFIDASDSTAPKITKRLYFDSYMIGSRRVGNRVHVVFQFHIQIPGILQNDQEFFNLVAQYQQAVDNGRMSEAEQIKQEIRQAIHKALEATDINTLLPRAVSRVDDIDTELRVLTCEDIYRPDVKMQPDLLLVLSVDMNGANLSETGIMNNAHLVYASKDHLYVSQSSQGWWWTTTQSSQTAIYKFGISDSKPTYLATGTINGWAKDQFSFSEHKGYLRVATTEDTFNQETNRWEPKNHLFVLEDNTAGELKVAGSVRDVAPGERIFAVRFLGDRGFIVTFRQIDPLFAFDLSDPTHPVLVGELEISGFSTYIHPIDQNHLLTVGREGSNLQLQIFDVSDLTAPKRLHQYTPPGSTSSYSDAESDHLAFTYYAPRNLLVIPLVVFTGSSESSFSGMAAYRVSLTQGFTELGRVDHADLARQAYCSQILPEELQRAQVCAQGWYILGARPRRSVIMTSQEAEYVYSISDIGIKATPVDAPGTVLGSVLFPNLGPQWWETVVIENNSL